MATQFDPRYRMTQNSFLGQDTSARNHYIQKSIDDTNSTFIFPAEHKDNTEQIGRDLKGGYTLNSISFSGEVCSKDGPALIGATEEIIRKVFPTHAGNLIKHHMQNPAYYSLTPLNHASPENDIYITAGTTSNDIFEHEGNLYLRTTSSNFTVTDRKSQKHQSLGDAKLEVLFKLTENGFELLEYNTNSPIVYDLLRGIKPTSLDWYKNRDRNTWTWWQQNSRLFEPVFPDSYVAPLGERLRNTYHQLFNTDNPYRSDVAAFFDWPSEDNDTHIFLKVVRYIGTFSFLSPIKNVFKLVLEGTPAFLEELGGWILDKSKQILSFPETDTTRTERNLARVGVVCGAILYGASKLTRQVTMRLTSPIRSMKEAYEFGAQAHWSVGILLGAVSAVVSVGLTALAAVVAGPVILVKGVFSIVATGVKAAAAWLGPKLSAIGGMVSTTTGAPTSVALGLKTVGLATMTTVALPVLPIVWGLSALISWGRNKYKSWRATSRAETARIIVANENSQIRQASNTPQIPRGPTTYVDPDLKNELEDGGVGYNPNEPTVAPPSQQVASSLAQGSSSALVSSALVLQPPQLTERAPDASLEAPRTDQSSVRVSSSSAALTPQIGSSSQSNHEQSQDRTLDPDQPRRNSNSGSSNP